MLVLGQVCQDLLGESSQIQEVVFGIALDELFGGMLRLCGSMSWMASIKLPQLSH